MTWLVCQLTSYDRLQDHLLLSSHSAFLIFSHLIFEFKAASLILSADLILVDNVFNEIPILIVICTLGLVPSWTALTDA